MNYRKDLIVIAVLLVAVIGFQFAFKKQPDDRELRDFRRMFATQRGYENHWAPDFEVALLDGDAFRLSEHLGSNVVVLNFWATWCGPCRREMPELAYFVEQHEDDPVVFVAVNVGERPEDVARYIEEEGLAFPVGLDMEREVADRYRVRGLPTTVVIGPDGRIRLYETGAIDNADVTLTPIVTAHLGLLRHGAAMSLASYHEHAPDRLPDQRRLAGEEEDDEADPYDDDRRFIPLRPEPAPDGDEEDDDEDR